MTTTTGAEVMTVPGLAAALHIGRRTAYRLVERGDVPSFRVGRAIRIPTRAVLEKYPVASRAAA